MKKLTLILFLSSIVLFSCKKDTTYLTQGQLIALRMEKDLNLSPNVTSEFSSIWVFNQSNSSVISSGGTSVIITSDGFIVISGTNFNSITFNLEQLKSYQLVPTGNLNLYF
jgi:hypothetical protein